MVRPKASEKNLKIAADFADAITTRIPKNDEKKQNMQVTCKGSNSIFAALRFCLPKITRHPNEAVLLHRNGVSEIELNKYLIKNGYESSRHRRRIYGTNRWCKGILLWTNIRWIDPEIPEELEAMNFHLEELIHRDSSISDVYHEPAISLLKCAVISFLKRAISAQPEDQEADSRLDNAPSHFEVAQNTFHSHKTGNRIGVATHTAIQPWGATWLCNPTRCVRPSDPNTQRCRSQHGTAPLIPPRPRPSLQWQPALCA
jgi:hypothetical protein